jgi:hypothetical protein
MFNEFKRPLLSAMALAALSLVTACGGGGDSPVSTSPTTPTVTVAGVASKGLLKKASVKVYKVVNGVKESTPLQTGTTDDTGGYELKGIPAGVAVLVEVTTTADTTMVDEATNTEVKAPANFTMRAATVTESGGSNAIQITPFSEMAVAKAESAEGGMTSDNIKASNFQVQKAFDFDFLTTKPAFDVVKDDDGKVTDVKPRNNAALMLAAISEMARSGSVSGCGGRSSVAAPSSAAEEEDTAVADNIACVVNHMKEVGVADDDLATKIGDALGDAQENEEYEADDTLPEIERVVPKRPVAVKEDLKDAQSQLSGIQQAKALVATLRANAPLLGGKDSPDSLGKRLSEVQATIEASTNPVSSGSLELVKAVSDAATMMQDLEGDSIVFDSGPQAMSVDRAKSGFCQYGYIDSSNKFVPATTAEATTAVGCRYTYGAPQDSTGYIPGVRAGFVYQHALRVLKTANGAHAVSSAVVKQKLTIEGAADNSSAANTVYLAGGSDAPIQGSVTFLPTGTAITGKLAAGVGQVLDGSALYNTVNLQLSFSEVPVDPEVVLTRINLQGTMTSGGGTGPEGTVTLGDGSYMQAWHEEPGNPSSAEGDQTYRQLHLELTASSGGSSIAGELTVQQAVNDDGLYDTVTEFLGKIKQDDSTELFTGQVTITNKGIPALVDEAQDQSLSTYPSEVSLVGDLYVPTRPKLSINVSLADDADGTRELTGRITQSGAIDLAIVAIESFDGRSATFSTGDLTLTISPKQDELNIFHKQVDNLVIATINAQNSRVDYADNSFEQF